jgi:hypothetical protein
LLTNSKLKLFENSQIKARTFAMYSTFGWTNGTTYSIDFIADSELLKTYTFIAGTPGSSASTFTIHYYKNSPMYVQYKTSTTTYISNQIPDSVRGLSSSHLLQRLCYVG